MGPQGNRPGNQDPLKPPVATVLTGDYVDNEVGGVAENEREAVNVEAAKPEGPSPGRFIAYVGGCGYKGHEVSFRLIDGAGRVAR
jgi:hypothetical protein